MASLSFVSLSLLFLILELHDVIGTEVRPKRLFVFGDSYSDTGNVVDHNTPSWQVPYGTTFPGHPDGRFADGRIFTDYVASFLNLKSPVAYRKRNPDEKLFPGGMNFAVSGAGVFDTGVNQTLEVQINQLQEQIAQGVFSKADLRFSVATIVISINDYMSFDDNGDWEVFKKFVSKVIGQLKADLKRLHELGMGKVAIGNLHPIGCVPVATTQPWNKHCNTQINDIVVSFHNKLLLDAVGDLNKNAGESGSSSPFTIIDLHGAFTHVLINETKRFPDILEPCCWNCAAKDDNGNLLNEPCSPRDSHFYWDEVHPSQAGWSAVFAALGDSLRQLFIEIPADTY